MCPVFLVGNIPAGGKKFTERSEATPKCGTRISDAGVRGSLLRRLVWTVRGAGQGA